MPVGVIQPVTFHRAGQRGLRAGWIAVAKVPQRILNEPQQLGVLVAGYWSTTSRSLWFSRSRGCQRVQAIAGGTTPRCIGCL